MDTYVAKKLLLMNFSHSEQFSRPRQIRYKHFLLYKFNTNSARGDRHIYVMYKVHIK